MRRNRISRKKRNYSKQKEEKNNYEKKLNFMNNNAEKN